MSIPTTICYGHDKILKINFEATPNCTIQYSPPLGCVERFDVKCVKGVETNMRKEKMEGGKFK